MRKIFLDCGFYAGSGFRMFAKTKEYDSDFVFYAFEPAWQIRPDKKIKVENNKIVSNKVIFSDRAVWIEDGEINFYTSSRRGGKANSLFKNTCAAKEATTPIKCIDFSKWILDNFTKEDYIILKMDIEGAEFKVLSKMIEDCSISYIKIAYVEFHNTRCSGWEKKTKQYKDLENKLLNVNGLEIRKRLEWFIAEKIILGNKS
jgi:FkbM family methyltransferase